MTRARSGTRVGAVAAGPVLGPRDPASAGRRGGEGPVEPRLRGCPLALVALLPALALAGPLTREEADGKRIYVSGESPSGSGISAKLGADAIVPASALPCAGCHGGDGLGRPEGGANPDVVLWSTLTGPRGHVHESGRRHGPFDERSLARAIRQGLDPAGNELDRVMPRYSLSSADMASLVAYLKVLERDTDPGIADRVVRIGTALPTKGRLASLGASIEGVLRGALESLNAAGGIHGRRLELVTAGFDVDRGDGREALARLLEEEDVFALVAGFTPGEDQDVADLVERERIPLVGPLTSFAPGTPGTQAFYVGAGVPEQARAIVRWGVAERRIDPRRVAVVHADLSPLAAAAAAAREELEAQGAGRTEAIAHPPGGLEPGLASRLAAREVTAVLYLGPDEDLATLARAAAAIGSVPELLLSGSLSARAAVEVPAAFAGRVHLAYGSLPSDESEIGAARLADARRLGNVGAEHRSAQVAAYAAVSVLGEGLRRTGRHLTRERLVASLEALFRYETGVTPPITYGPRRRVGARGAYVVAVDLERGGFSPVSGWIGLDGAPPGQAGLRSSNQ